MRIALLCPDLVDAPFGGIPMVSRQALRQLVRIATERRVALDIDVWALHDKRDKDVDLAQEYGLTLPIRRYRAFGGSRILMLAAAAREGEREGVDLVFTTHIGLGVVGRLLRRRGAAMIQFLHGVEAWRRLPGHQRAGLAATDGLISNSAFTLKRFQAWNPDLCGIPSRVVWLGLPLDVAPSVAEDAAIPSGGPGPRVLIVGRICGHERYKGHEELIHVWSEVRRYFPNACLDIVGDGDARAELTACATRLGHTDTGAIRFWGRVSAEELRAHYRDATVFAMPSRGEGFGIVYLEAMAYGKPCIGSRDDAAREVIVQDETGLLIRYGDRGELVSVLFELFSDPAQAKRLGAAGRARVRKHFEEAHFGERLWAALSALCPAFAAEASQ